MSVEMFLAWLGAVFCAVVAIAYMILAMAIAIGAIREEISEIRGPRK